MSRIYAFPSERRAPSSSRAARERAVALSEVFAGQAPAAGAAATGFVLSRLQTTVDRPILWIQDRLSRREGGRPYLPGLAVGQPLLMLELARPADVMVAAEEGLRCKALGAVVADLWGDSPAVNFTATKRLALRAESSGVGCWLVRHGATADLSAARDRWRISPLPSATNPDDSHAPGAPRWQVELFRSRDKRPGIWVAQHDRTDDQTRLWATDRLDLVARLPDGTLAEGGGGAGQRATP